MLYQMEVAQKKSGNLLVAATPAHPTAAVSGRSEAAPYQNGEALLGVARAAGCGPETLAAIEEVVRHAQSQPDVPIQSRILELAETQVHTLGL